jgi:hypothetical protein
VDDRRFGELHLAPMRLARQEVPDFVLDLINACVSARRFALGCAIVSLAAAVLSAPACGHCRVRVRRNDGGGLSVDPLLTYKLSSQFSYFHQGENNREPKFVAVGDRNFDEVAGHREA